MKVIFQLQNADHLNVELTVVSTVGELKKLRDQIKTGGGEAYYGPMGRLTECINETVTKAEQTYSASRADPDVKLNE